MQCKITIDGVEYTIDLSQRQLNGLRFGDAVDLRDLVLADGSSEPVVLGHSWAPEAYEGKCLCPGENYIMQLLEEGDRGQALIVRDTRVAVQPYVCEVDDVMYSLMMREDQVEWVKANGTGPLFNFGEAFTIGDSSRDKPFFIGDGLAPNGLEYKCIVVHEDYVLEVKEHDGRKLLYFKKK